MQIEFIIKEDRDSDTWLAIIGGLLCALFIGLVAWRVTHYQPKEPTPRELTQEERTSQALALAGVAAAGNPSTAIYTPLLLGAAANVKEGGTTNAVLHPAK